MKKALMLVAVLTLVLTAGSVQAATRHITIAHGSPAEHSSHLGWEKFKEIVERESKGNITCEIFPNQQMGGDREVTEAVQLGNLTCGLPSSSPLAGFCKEFYILDVPFLMGDRAAAYATLDGEAGQLLLDSLEAINIKGLGFFENGFRNLTANKKILSPEDLKGVKLRVMENKIQMLAWSSFGANPTPIAFGELFTALQQGTVDAQENPFELIFTNKFYEVQKFLMVTNHIYTPFVVLMNLEFYNSCTPEEQALFIKATREASAYQRDIAKGNETKARDAIAKTREIVDLTEAQKQVFKDKLGPVYAEARKAVGNEKVADAFLGKGK